MASQPWSKSSPKGDELPVRRAWCVRANASVTGVTKRARDHPRYLLAIQGIEGLVAKDANATQQIDPCWSLADERRYVRDHREVMQQDQRKPNQGHRIGSVRECALSPWLERRKQWWREGGGIVCRRTRATAAGY